MRGMQALERVVKYDNVKTVLDIGSWRGEQAQYMKSHGKDVKTVDFNVAADYHGDFLNIQFDRMFDCVWCSHTLEHQANVGTFLSRCFHILEDNGLLAITVPSMKKYGNRVVDGHLTYWNAGILLYNLIVAGFDCSKARVGTYNNEVSVLVNKKRADLPKLTGDRGEISRLAKFFPMKVEQGFDGYIEKLNW